MENDQIEMPQIEIPDEVRQVEIPEIGETTPHPKPDSPLASSDTAGHAEGEATGAVIQHIGFVPPKIW
ncbi:hypothetical protein AN963_14880 [Brevibacillus choshinensis]|uniref:Uncharacterized protein n=1 Tax=Brevibacillus choshinensis TaxID=54911 RepID=A0ABR5N6I3_BRECH|nr:hypothetical protein [Brevibacillus choshinensis]KQL46252.1 hypothetical protein AN963_14880 [Brevibacillus choshinensis]MED4583998.1 hypothetical protein [Brevibacillus choshinensis]MED4783942.1 hypothetical protein [Brevibacillus choshinensis]